MEGEVYGPPAGASSEQGVRGALSQALNCKRRKCKTCMCLCIGKLLPSAHAVDREYAVMTGLHPTGFPVPKTYGLCEDSAVLGSKFLVMSLADGRSLWNGALPGREPDERRAIYNSLIDTMADMHLNYHRVPLFSPSKLSRECHTARVA